MNLLQDERPVRRNSGNGFFIWSVVLLLMTGVCFASWIGSFYVFKHPENPKCYRILKRFKRIEPPKRFAVTEAPKGEFLSAARLLDRYGKLGKVELAFENEVLMRNYVTNFRESGRRVPYLAGKFQIVQSFDLTGSDWFPAGAVAIAQSESLPQMLVEFVFPSAPSDVPAIRETVTMGVEVALQRSQDLWALVHVERHADGRMQFTALPLPYGGWQLKNGDGSFTLQSPEELAQQRKLELNLAAGLPIVRDPRLAKALAEHKEFRRRALARGGDDQAALAGPELVRYEPPKNSESEPGDDGKSVANPQGNRPASTPVPRTVQVARPVPTPAPAVPLPPRPIVKSRPGTGIIGADPTPEPAAPKPTPSAVATVPAPPPAAPSGNGGRVLTTSEASGLVDRFAASGPALLSGDFVVTGVLGTRVALRTAESLRDPDADPKRPGSSAALIIVEYPQGAVIPQKDATFSRDSERGFVIRDVIRARNGQITIVANERTAE